MSELYCCMQLMHWYEPGSSLSKSKSYLSRACYSSNCLCSLAAQNTNAENNRQSIGRHVVVMQRLESLASLTSPTLIPTPRLADAMLSDTGYWLSLSTTFANGHLSLATVRRRHHHRDTCCGGFLDIAECTSTTPQSQSAS